MNNVKYSINDKLSIYTPQERMSLGLNSVFRIFHLQRMRRIDINVDDEKISLEGQKTFIFGDLHLDVKKEDFRGSTVNYQAFNLCGIILGFLLSAAGIFGLIVYIFDLFGNEGDSMPIGLGTIALALGLLFLIPSFFRRTILTLRFVDKNSNSVRHLSIKVRRNSQEHYQTANEFIEKLWSENA